MDPENMDWHLISSHGIRKHMEAETPKEDWGDVTQMFPSARGGS